MKILKFIAVVSVIFALTSCKSYRIERLESRLQRLSPESFIDTTIVIDTTIRIIHELERVASIPVKSMNLEPIVFEVVTPSGVFIVFDTIQDTLFIDVQCPEQVIEVKSEKKVDGIIQRPRLKDHQMIVDERIFHGLLFVLLVLLTSLVVHVVLK